MQRIGHGKYMYKSPKSRFAELHASGLNEGMGSGSHTSVRLQKRRDQRRTYSMGLALRKRSRSDWIKMHIFGNDRRVSIGYEHTQAYTQEHRHNV